MTHFTLHLEGESDDPDAVGKIRQLFTDNVAQLDAIGTRPVEGVCTTVGVDGSTWSVQASAVRPEQAPAT